MAFYKYVIALFIVCAFYFTADAYCDSKCVEYGWKNAFLTSKGVFCERPVSSSYEVPYLPLEGARRFYEYQKRHIIPSTEQGDT